MDVLTKFITMMMAISIASERVVEMLKGWFPGFPLFKPLSDPQKESQRIAFMHLLSGVVGSIVAAVSHVNVFSLLPVVKPADPKPVETLGHMILSYIVCGLLASGGSAFWNHALDIIKAVKVQQEMKQVQQEAEGSSTNLKNSTQKELPMSTATKPAVIGNLEAATCHMTPNPAPGPGLPDINATAGNLVFVLLPVKNIITFDPGNCQVVDESGTVVPFNPAITGTSFGFDAVAGKTYTATGLFLAEGDSEARLAENCAAQTPFLTVTDATPNFRLVIAVA